MATSTHDNENAMLVQVHAMDELPPFLHAAWHTTSRPSGIGAGLHSTVAALVRRAAVRWALAPRLHGASDDGGRDEDRRCGNVGRAASWSGRTRRACAVHVASVLVSGRRSEAVDRGR